jgi:hypothetical protein
MVSLCKAALRDPQYRGAPRRARRPLLLYYFSSSSRGSQSDSSGI